MNESWTSRRQFLKLLGGVIGSSTLIPLLGCEDDGNGSAGVALTDAAFPAAYRFFAIVDSDELPITPGIMINDRSEIALFSAENVSGGGTAALLEYRIDYRGDTPAIAARRTVVRHGDVLADGRRVDRLAVVDTNARGHYVFVIDTQPQDGESPTTQHTSAVYTEAGKGGLQRLTRYGDSADDQTRHGGMVGDVTLNDSDEVVVVSYLTNPTTMEISQSLVMYPSLDAPSGAARVLLRTGQMIPQSSSILRAIGLVDMNDIGDCVIQGRGGPAGDPATEGTVLIYNDGSSLRLVSASATLTDAQPDTVGDIYFGPRVGRNGVLAYVHHPADNFTVLAGQSAGMHQMITSKGMMSPAGNVLRGMSAPVVAPNGLIFQQLYTNASPAPGVELIVTNGIEQRTVLAQGDLEYKGLPLVHIVSGYHSKQVDNAGRIVFMAEFGDNVESGRSVQALMVGIPV